MKDIDLLTFGKHKGTPVEDVPASHLFWFLWQPWAKKLWECGGVDKLKLNIGHILKKKKLPMKVNKTKLKHYIKQELESWYRIPYKSRKSKLYTHYTIGKVHFKEIVKKAYIAGAESTTKIK